MPRLIPLKPLFYILLFSLSYLTGTAQRAHFISSYIIPRNPAINDSIFIVDSMLVSTPSCTRTSYSLLIAGDSIIIHSCYRDTTGFDMDWVINDTTPIGLFHEGIYSLFLYSRIHRSWIDSSYNCSDLINRDSTHFDFTVTRYNTSIDEQSIETFSLSPNPVTATIYLNKSLNYCQIEISDMSGRLFGTPHTEREIDVSGLAKGVYTLRLRNKEGTAVKRFIKE
jgi:hypothetical protein